MLGAGLKMIKKVTIALNSVMRNQEAVTDYTLTAVKKVQLKRPWIN